MANVDKFLALFGLVGTLLGAFIGYYATITSVKRTEKVESARWYSSFFVQKKIDRLADLQSALASCRFETQIFLNAPNYSQEEKNDLRLSLKEFRKSLDLVTMYLSSEDWSTINNARAVFELLAMKKYSKEVLVSKDWDDFEKSAANAMTRLKSLLTLDEKTIFEAREESSEQFLNATFSPRQDNVKFCELSYKKIIVVLVTLMIITIGFSFAAAFFNINLPTGNPNFSNQIFVIFYPLGIVLALGATATLIADISEVKISRQFNQIQAIVREAIKKT